MDKVKLKTSWRLFYKKDGYGVIPIVCLTNPDSGKKIEISMNEGAIPLNAYCNIQELSEKTVLEEAHIVPGVLYEIQIRTASGAKYKLAISRCASREELYSMSVRICSKDSNRDIVGKLMRKHNVLGILQNFKDVFTPYEFLELPFGECFNGNTINT